jgi:hypothetical protein
MWCKVKANRDSVPSCVGEMGGGVGERESEASAAC